jgi:thioester reductase-like protein
VSRRQRVEGPGEAILFTGATGFLGAYLLADQLNRYPDLSIYCLVRADGPGMARSRVRSNLEHYGLWQESYGQRLIGVPGNLAEPHLGLDAHTWDALGDRLSGILHNGAQLSYVAPYGQLKASNVLGTSEVLRLAAARCTASRPALPVEFISSTAVYEAAAYRGRDLDETSDLSEWQGIHLGYSQTKWVSERLVWNAALQGMPVRIYRPPLIGGHSQTGAWHEQDFLHRFLRGCLQMGLAPDLTMSLDLVPVDYVVAAVGAMAWSPQPDQETPPVFHLHHPDPVLWTDLLSGLIAMGAPLRVATLQSWLTSLASDPSNPLYPLQPFFTHRWGPEQLTYPELNTPTLRARPGCAITQAALEPLGIRCPAFSQLLQTYARTFLTEPRRYG